MFLLSLLISTHLFATVSAQNIIEESPPLLVSCRAQVLIFPRASTTDITQELLTKGFRMDRILIHNRIEPGSFYAFGEIVTTVLPSQFDMAKEKLHAAEVARLAFLTGRSFHSLENSIRLLGCRVDPLQ